MDGSNVMEISVNVGRRLNGNRACVTFPTSSLSVGTTFDLILEGADGDNFMDVGNVTIVA